MAGNETHSVEELLQRAQAWLSGDPDADTRAELASILERRDLREIEERFAQSLEFGTAGLRGVLGAGANRMNRAVVLRTSFGVARHLLADVPNAARRGVVVGCDARRMSRLFAEDAAGVFAAAGLVVHWFDTVVPTPLVAFAVAFLGAAGGIVITASHNPAEYNGYKVYGPNGAQIVAPRDDAISRAITQAPSARSIDRDSIEKARHKGYLTVLSDDIEAAYVDGVQNLMLAPRTRPPLSIVYTPLHGVGHRLARRVLVAAGFGEPIAVGDQVAPDPAFPTTPFPNPEESGVLDRALALAREKNADLVLANDPDADRLAVAIKDEKGSFVQLSGNQVGVLLGHYLLTEDRRPGDRAVITTIVSSPMLGEIAARLGVYHEETLTGFKWIASRALELAAGGKRFVFGYEEALGYAIGDLVRDKDGLSAAAMFAEMAAVQKARGTTVFAYLSDLYRMFGFHASAQRSIRMPGNEGAIRIERLMSALRRDPPLRVGAMAVIEWRDHQKRIRVRVDGSAESLALPASNVLVFSLEGDNRVVIRPSGTEPKLKVYLDHRENVGTDESIGAAEMRARVVLSSLESAVRSLIPMAGG